MKKRFLIPIVLSACLLMACDPGSSRVSGNTTSFSVDSAGGNASMSKMANSVNSTMDSDFDVDYGTSAETSDTLSENQTTTSRKLIRIVSLSFTIPNSDALSDYVNSISKEAEKLGGYVASNNSTYGDYANGSLSLKIPADKADEFIENLKGSGMKLTNTSDSTEDVTLQYVDVESRLKVKEQTKAKYEEYLSLATNVEDTMNIEKELSSVIADIESYRSQLNVLKDQIDYTSIYVDINCEVSAEAQTFGEEFISTLKNLRSEVGGTFIDAFCWFVNTIVVLIFAIPIFVIVIRVFMFAIGKTWMRKKKAENKTEKKAEKKISVPEKTETKQV